MKTLSEFIKDNPAYFSDQQNAYRLLHQLLEALAKLHGKGELHLGLSPETIIIDGDNNTATLEAPDKFKRLSRDSSYAAPEATPEARSDLYSLGKVLEELSLPKQYRDIVERCTAVDSSQRFGSAREILALIDSERPSHKKWIVVAAIAVAALVAWLMLKPAPRHHSEDTASTSVTKHESNPMETLSSPIEETDTVAEEEEEEEATSEEDAAEEKAQSDKLQKEMKEAAKPLFNKILAHYSDSSFNKIDQQRFNDEKHRFEREAEAVKNTLWKKHQAEYEIFDFTNEWKKALAALEDDLIRRMKKKE